jgi:hypothetical protein
VCLRLGRQQIVRNSQTHTDTEIPESKKPDVHTKKKKWKITHR